MILLLHSICNAPHLEMEQCGINFRHKSLSAQVGYFLLLHSSKATSIHLLHIPHLCHPKVYVFFAKTLNSCLLLHVILNGCKNFSHNMTIRQALAQKKARKLVLRNVPDLIHSVVCSVGHKSIHVRTMSVQTSTPPVRCISPNKSPMRRRDLTSVHLKKYP